VNNSITLNPQSVCFHTEVLRGAIWTFYCLVGHLDRVYETIVNTLYHALRH
jgi:hypothetical protein